MAFWERDKKVVKRKMAVQQFPTQRVSVEEQLSILDMLDSMQGSYASLANYLPFELYDYVELIAQYNPDYNQAVDNIKNLANPGFAILVNGKDEKSAQVCRDKIREKQKTIKSRLGGFPGIVRNLLVQGAVYGAMGGEWVLKDDLSDVVDFAFVNPKNVRFFWDKVENDWHPHQKVGLNNFSTVKTDSQWDCIRLNTNTFMYQTINSINNSPYGIPPLFSSLENISIQREMINNLKSVSKKLGMLGIIEVIIERLDVEAEETPQEYMNRCTDYLTKYQGLIQGMVNEGGIVHFDDSKVTNLSIAERVQGAAEIFKLNEELIFSGLHSLPSVQGRSYSTTETYASVAYEVLLRSVGDYTAAVKSILESGLWLMSKMWGTNVDSIEVKFGNNKSLNLLMEAQAEAIVLKNDMWKWDNGLLNQQQVAQRHGIDAPAVPMVEPKSPPVGSADGGVKWFEEDDDLMQKVKMLVEEKYNTKTASDDMVRSASEYKSNLVELFDPVRNLAGQLVDRIKGESS